MKPDLDNKWMEAELGTFDDPSAKKAPKTKKSTANLMTVWDFFYVVLRVAVSLFFAFHGAQKLFGIFGGEHVQQDHTLLAMGILEFLGGVILALGVYTRPVTLVMFVETAWVYYKLCPVGTYWPIPTGGELPILFCAFFLFLAVFGPGNISIDRMQRRG